MNTGFNLDWGSVSPDGYKKEKNTCIYVLNFYMVTDDARTMARKYIVGKVLWHIKHLPEKTKIHLRLDIQGQSEIKYEFDLMRSWKTSVLTEITKAEPTADVYMDIIA